MNKQYLINNPIFPIFPHKSISSNILTLQKICIYYNDIIEICWVSQSSEYIPEINNILIRRTPILIFLN